MFGGIARLTRDSDSAGVEFRIAAAGPAVTLVIAAACSAIGIAAAGTTDFVDAMLVREDAAIDGALALVAWLAFINFLILAFNLIPAYPLDGGRIARAIAWRLTGSRNRATKFAARVGQGFSYLFIALGIALVLFTEAVITGIWLGIVGFILGSSARGAVVQTELQSRLEGLRIADVMDPEPVAIRDDTTVAEALDDYFLRYRWPWFPVTDGAEHFLGLIERGAADAVGSRARAGSPRSSSPTRAAVSRSWPMLRSRTCSATTRCDGSAHWRRSTSTAACAGSSRPRASAAPSVT
jgi:hypothetical protein